MLHILVTCYNCQTWLPRCLQSILVQAPVDFRCCVFDDVSTDASSAAFQRLVGRDPRFEYVRNYRKHWQTGNYDQYCRERDWDDNDIAMQLDGDDYLPADTQVLSRIVERFANPQLWFAWGSCIAHPSGHRCCDPLRDTAGVRQGPFHLGPTRVWRMFLWRAIQRDSLLWKDGWYIPSACDMAFGFPMLEMSREGHWLQMPEINYVYNERNPLSDRLRRPQLEEECDQWVRALPEYPALDRRTVTTSS